MGWPRMWCAPGLYWLHRTSGAAHSWSLYWTNDLAGGHTDEDIGGGPFTVIIELVLKGRFAWYERNDSRCTEPDSGMSSSNSIYTWC